MGISRRTFLGGASLAFVAVPRRILGGPGQQPPSETLNIACIGIDGKGRSDVDGVASQNIVALCDVDESRGAHHFKKFPKAKRYSDFRVMLEEQGSYIDAVTVSTPDHVHAPASMMAIRMGKHVFCQKPLTHSVHEARQLGEAARKHKVASVMGIQGHCSEYPRLLCEWLWAGLIGQVREVHIWTNRPIWPQGIDRPKDTPEVPAGLNWDAWLGPAPERPYHPAYHPFKWRGWWDFGTGALGDIACHAFDAAFWALRLGHPTSVEAVSSPFNDETYPSWSIITYQFPARGDLAPLRLVWYDGGKLPPRPKELEPGRKLGTNGKLYIGDKGVIFNERVIPETRMQELRSSLPPKTLPRSPGIYDEFIRACKGGEPCGANFENFAGPLTEVVLLGNIALRCRQKIEWDPVKFRITNVPEANDFLHRAYRKGWTL